MPRKIREIFFEKQLILGIRIAFQFYEPKIQLPKIIFENHVATNISNSFILQSM